MFFVSRGRQSWKVDGRFAKNAIQRIRNYSGLILVRFSGWRHSWRFRRFKLGQVRLVRKCFSLFVFVIWEDTLLLLLNCSLNNIFTFFGKINFNWISFKYFLRNFKMIFLKGRWNSTEMFFQLNSKSWQHPNKA